MNEELGRRLASLSPDRIQALVRRLHGPAGAAAPVPLPAAPSGRFPLSSAQERMWFLAQLAPDSPALNNPGALRARRDAPLDRGRMEAAVRAFARRHEALRTTFHAEDGQPFQEVHDDLPPVFTWHDLRHLPAAEREAAALEIARQEGLRRFDLATGPLFAFGIVVIGEGDYLLLNTTHHIVSDGWSNALLAREIAALYAGEAAAGPPPARRYADFVRWERDWLEGAEARAKLARRSALLAEDVPLALPTDRPRPAAMSRRGGLETLRLPAGLAGRLRDFARGERVSLFHLMMAGLGAVLHRWSGQATITVGTQTANRNLREFRDVFGLFINTVVIRTEIDGEASFRTLLHRTRELCLDALRDEALPFERLVGELNPPRSLNRHPVFQVMLVHQNVPALYEVPGMRLEVLKIDYGTAKFDLNLWVEELGDEIALTLHFAADLFDAATARRLLLHFRGLLEAALAGPDEAVAALDFATAGDRAAARPAETPVRQADPRCLAARIAAQAALTPDAPAAEGEDGVLTYRELDRRANRIARALAARGAGPERVVAVLAPRSAALMAALLGIWRSGAAFLVLDPAHPAERIAAMLADAGVGVALAAAGADRGLLPPGPAVLDLDRDPAIREADDGAFLPPGDATRLAYLVYTSGSSGAPKGVAVEHRHLAAYCDAIWPAMGLGAGDRFASVSSPAADLGYTMLFPPLLHGGTVVLVPEPLAVDPVGLPAWFARRPADCLKLVPSHLRALWEAGRPAGLLPRKLLMLGGEACPADLVAAVMAAAPGCRVMNHYGPSETTVGVLAHEVAAPPGGGTVPLGRPLGAARVDVLDSRMRPAPVGVPGEIFIGGPSVARGYAGRPERTAERFVPDPRRPGERLYRTGDRARRLADGTIAFLGRADRQFKLRGHRIEPGEIEAALAAHPAVAQAVVLPPGEDGAPPPALTAFVLRRAGGEAGPETLADHLRARLPGPMVPARFAFPDALPLTPNGKIDHRALARMPAEERDGRSRAPRDAVELGLLHLWRDLLGTDGIGIDDSFFDLGGHSLLAVRLVAAIHARWGRHVQLADLFVHGTIRRLAALIGAGGARERDPLVAIQPRGQGAPRYFVHPAGGQVLCYYELAQALGDGAPFHGLQAVPGAMGPGGSVADLAERYLDALPGASGAVPVFGGWSMGALVAFAMARLHLERHGTAPVVAILDQVAPGAGDDAGSGDEAGRLATFAGKVSELVGEDIGLPEPLLRAAGDGAAGLFLDRFKRHQLAPEDTRIEDFRGFLDLMLAHNRITGDYRGGPYPGRVIVFRAEGRRSDGGAGPELGWQRHAVHRVEVVPVPGTHVSMMRAPHVAVLAERMLAVLAS